MRRIGKAGSDVKQLVADDEVWVRVPPAPDFDCPDGRPRVVKLGNGVTAGDGGRWYYQDARWRGDAEDCGPLASDDVPAFAGHAATARTSKSGDT